MRCDNPRHDPARQARSLCALFLLLSPCVTNLLAQQPQAAPAVHLPDAPSAAVLSGTVTDTDEAIISNAHITLEDAETKAARATQSDVTGAFSFLAVPPG